ncbi:acyl-CoA N-acyltransferase [Cucurbitaria berberidis CBS 394.84]|uniref:Acyl-CoA N-acyltransferase n=1 Tax=Cucurbitaria berberidis CBS 394.84 TaxID=1168544 RepID=A0A9P4GND9_9PLEO|nr:acyl-CoA N-acyltransferase [Cucurbitaria berberidis CBS 394.84]KAF1848852.1 acyl-CoA N-acyltransferase [Cucurbitaria berberidis CBS 394.84]
MSHPTPFSSARLTYHAIRQPDDLALFKAINADQTGYQNSNASNIKLPSHADAEKFMKATAEENLLGAVIWLAPENQQTAGEIKARRNAGEIVEAWGTAIGELHLSALPAHLTHHRWTELGIDILPAYQGRGYGAEAIGWALDYAFRRAGLHRVKIRAFEWNTGAIRLYKKLGFTVEGSEREALWFEGRWWDGVEMGMLESEWWEMERTTQRGEEERA